MDFFDNEITRAVQRMQGRLDILPPDTLAMLDETAKLESSELVVFGDMPTRGLAAGVISAEGAQALHAIHRTFSRSTLAERMIFIQTIGELHKKGV